MYLVYHVEIAKEHVEMAQALLSLDVEMDGVSYDEKGFSFYVSVTKDQTSIQTALKKVDATFNLSYTPSELEDKNWNAEWESDFKSVEVRGYCRVRAPFHDHNSVESSEMNKGLNHEQHINITQSDVTNYEGKSYDVILANINRNVIISSMTSFKDKLAYKGTIIASGYLEVDLRIVREAALSAGLNVISSAQRGEWMCQTFG